MKKNLLFFILFIIVSVSVKAQQQIAFSFGESPQTLMLNPGAETNFSRHYGIPIFSNFSLTLGTTGFELADLFLKDNRDFTSKFRDVLSKVNQDDYININAKIDILNGGYRYDDRTYISFGFYQEVDIITYMPKDIAELFYYGNQPYLNRAFSFSQISMKADILGVLHAGISRKVDEKLNIGARVKIYSSSLNVESTNNSGTLTTFNNNENILRQSLNNLDVQFRTSGLIASNDEFLENPGDLFSKTFLGGNLGLGLDFGLTYHFTPQI